VTDRDSVNRLTESETTAAALLTCCRQS